MIPFIRKENNIIFVLEGKAYNINFEDKNYSEIVTCLRDKDFDKIENFLLTPNKIEKYSKGNLELKNNSIYYKGRILENYLVEKILFFLEEEVDVYPLLNFLEKLMQNPSNRSVTDLFLFLEAGRLPIANDGDFYGYKAVRPDYLDIYSSTLDNSIGQILKMERNEVEDNSSISCSTGLHVGTLSYVKGYGGTNSQKIIVKVNPKDVVSVPSSEQEKLRCCRYEVVSNFDEKLPETIYIHKI